MKRLKLFMLTAATTAAYIFPVLADSASTTILSAAATSPTLTNAVEIEYTLAILIIMVLLT